MNRTRKLLMLAGTWLAGSLAASAGAEVSELKIAQQYGLNYLQLMLMEEQGLIEKHAREEGLDQLKVSWPRLSSGSLMNDALLSGDLHFVSGGVGPMITLWAKTRGGIDVRAVCAINSMPVVLTTRNPDVKTLKDFTDKDKIALPAIKVSIQAVTLQMAAAQIFGDANFNRLDSLTVAMSHPDGVIAMLSGGSEVDSHFTGPPFNYQELRNPAIHKVLSSYDVLDGRTTSTLVWTTARFRSENPKVYRAFFGAVQEATQIINRDKTAAAELYVRVAKTKDKVEDIMEVLNDPDIQYMLAPEKVTTYASFMYRVGSIKVQPASWKDLFFPEIYALPGS
jgi:NitT/TauT family transport system substrate-binding protein